MPRLLACQASTLALGSGLPFTAHASESQYVPGLEGIKGSVVPPPGVYYRVYLANYSSDENETLPPGSNVDVGALVNEPLIRLPSKVFSFEYSL